MELTMIHVETEPEEVVVAVVLFDGKVWKLRTVAPPEPEMMSDLKKGLTLLAGQFTKDGF
jgi:hypothetical protein